MSKTDEFRQEVKEVTNDTWYLKEGQEYIRATDKVILVHRKCGTEKAVTPKDFRYRGVHCRVCKETVENTRKYKSRRAGLTAKEFEQRVEDRFGSDYQVIVPYKNENTKVKIKHLVCGKEFWVYPTNFVKEKHGCPSCASKRGRVAQLKNSNQIWNQETFVNKVKDLTGDEYSVLGTYTKSIEKVKMKHNKCGNIFYMAPNHFVNKHERCPYCKNSHGEVLVAQVLKNEYHLIEGENYIHGYVLPSKLRLDFYLPNYQIAIEYDGLQHYKPISLYGGEKQFRIQQERDKRKEKWCEDHDINLIRIPYTNNTYFQVHQRIAEYF